MNKLDDISIQPDGKSAWFQAGTYGNQITDFLWDRGYVTTTAGAQCISLLGPGLGGGHGSHQGSIGMISDNFRQLNVVLANGSTIRVNSKSHSDLLWGLKGAGHNFGIVTSVEMGIYPRGPATWYCHNYIWRGDKLVNVFNAVNKLSGYGTLPLKMAINYGTFLMNSSISTEEPVILWTFSYAGSAEEAAPYFASFNAIESVWEESGEVPYPMISTAQSNGVNSTLCQKYAVDKLITTAGLQIYNLTTEQEIWDGFKRRVISNPDLANAVFIIHEGYSNQAVAKHDPADSAYPFRDDYHLMMFQGTTGDNSTLKDDMWKWGREVKELWNAGQPGRPVDSYVNYANGFEGPEEWYGHEAWRQNKLRALKAKYDPYNRFRFYNPIV